MRTVRVRTRVACVVGAMALLFPFAPALAASGDNHNRPVDVTFTKWGVTAPPLPAPQPPFGLFEGFAGDSPLGCSSRRSLATTSLNGHVNGLRPCTRSWTGTVRSRALIRGGRIRRARPTSTASSWLGGAPARGYRSSTRGIPRLSGCRAARGHQKQDVLRGDDSRRSRPTRLSTARAQASGASLAARLLTPQPGPSNRHRPHRAGAIRRSSSKKLKVKTSRSGGRSNEPSSGGTATRSPSGCRSNERWPVCGPM